MHLAHVFLAQIQDSSGQTKPLNHGKFMYIQGYPW